MRGWMAIIRGSWISGAIAASPAHTLGEQVQIVEVSVP